MATQITTDGYIFDFADDVIDAYIFDSQEHNSIQNMMKAVDVIAEFPDEYLFIELKKYQRGEIEFRCPLWGDKGLIKSNCPLTMDDDKRTKATVKRIAHELRCKYCDTLLYYFAENKLDKQVNYICVVEGCDAAQTLRLGEILSLQMPKGIPPQTHWVRPIVKNLVVVNVNGWNASDKLNRYGRCSFTV